MQKLELQKHLSELRLELAKDKGQVAIGGAIANPGKLKEIRKTIARILTELKRREVVKTGSM